MNQIKKKVAPSGKKQERKPPKPKKAKSNPKKAPKTKNKRGGKRNDGD